MDTSANHTGDAAVAFLRQVAELIAIDNLPAPITVTVYKKAVLVRDEHLSTWCNALGVEVPAFEVGEHNNATEFASVDVLGFRLESNRPVEQAVA